MKHIAFLLFSVFSSIGMMGQITNYKYTFKIKGAKDTIYLANYLAKQLYYNDTALADKNGTFVFTKPREIKPGKFAVVQPGKMYFELLINEAAFTFKGDTGNLIGGMTIENSLENKLFYDYIKLINNKKREIDPLNSKYRASESDEEKERLLEKINALNKEVSDFQASIVKDHPTTLIAQVINMSIDVEIPEAPLNPDGSKDSTFSYYYYRDHYWDNTNLSNDALVRDPSFIKKLETYFDKIVVQHPDTLSLYADELVAQMDKEGEMFKITVNWLINHYSKSKIMGLDAVFDTSGNRLISLSSVKAKYTVLYFWDSGCGHCKKATPKLKKIYDELHKYDVEVYAVGGELETKDWKKYIKENKLPWINVSDTPERPNGFRTVYDIYAYPKVFLLDENKKIIAKQIGVEQLGDILLDKLKLKDKIDFGFVKSEDDDEEEAH